MKRILTFAFIFLSTGLWAQSEFESYTWNTIPAQNQSDTIKSVDGTVVLLERRITEIYANKQSVFEEIFVFHKKIKVETHQAVNEQNKIYIPIGNVIDILKIEARFISPGGKITNLKKESIKEVENLENKGNFKTFAIEGAEVGGQIEYYYILRKKLTAYGGIFIQEDVPKGDVVVIYAFPQKLGFIFKSYNGFPDFKLTPGEEGKLSYLRAGCGYIPSLRPERYAYYKANLMRYEFTMAYNYYNSLLRVYSWTQAGRNVYDNLIPLKKNEESAVRSWLKKMKLPEKDQESKIRAIENIVKAEISISEDIKDEMDLEDIIKQKQSNKFNSIRLFAALFQTENIDFEIVLTSDMETEPFDPDFNCYNFMDNYLIYFPAIDAYLTPDDPSYRLGLTPSNYQGGYGIFMHPIAYNEKLKTMAYDVKKIPVTSCFTNTDSLYQDIYIDIDQAELKAKSRRVFFGDIGRNFQSFWDFIDNDRKDEIIKVIFNMGSENTHVDSYKVKNDSPENIGVNPIDWDLNITAGSLVESAGDDIIVKIGETIGTQSELYQSSTRKLPVKIDVLRNYYRKIIFNIPEGYTITNPADLNMHVEMINNGKTSCIFTSEATVTGNQLLIISKEYYSETDYPVSRYEEFRKVINASADYNKKTILLKKK